MTIDVPFGGRREINKMKATLRQYSIGIAVALASVAASALPLSVIDGSGLPSTPAAVTLNDGSASSLEAATILIQFDPTRLDYASAVIGTLFPTGTIHTQNLADSTLGRVILGISSNANPVSDGTAGSLVTVNFDILASAPVGLTEVSFRCVPIDPNEQVDAVTDQASADSLCLPDYAIPVTVGNVNVLAPTNGQVPTPATAALALLGLGLMGWVRRRLGFRASASIKRAE